MNSQFDEDIKIYGKDTPSDGPDFDSIAEKIDFNKANGNEEKAEKLGEIFAQLKPTDEGLCLLDPESGVSASVLYHARVLITFLCGRAIKTEVRDSFLVDTARNSMYDYLKKNEPGYYKNLTDGAAYSFYRLALKKSGDASLLIGQEFAKLCSAAKDERIIALGQRIYTNTTAYAKAVIEKCEFKY